MHVNSRYEVSNHQIDCVNIVDGGGTICYQVNEAHEETMSI